MPPVYTVIIASWRVTCYDKKASISIKQTPERTVLLVNPCLDAFLRVKINWGALFRTWMIWLPYHFDFCSVLPVPNTFTFKYTTYVYLYIWVYSGEQESKLYEWNSTVITFLDQISISIKLLLWNRSNRYSTKIYWCLEYFIPSATFLDQSLLWFGFVATGRGGRTKY